MLGADPIEYVSLFTREWIEMVQSSRVAWGAYCLPLYEGVDWNWKISNLLKNAMRLPLYEGVDWNHVWHNAKNKDKAVSLFTREWIEMERCGCKAFIKLMSPSLRGSGLKSWIAWKETQYRRIVSLFTREWIEIAMPLNSCKAAESLPLYEGVDWNTLGRFCIQKPNGLPLYEGVDWNRGHTGRVRGSEVSPSLRGSGLKLFCVAGRPRRKRRLPLYEGVDWNHSVSVFGCRRQTVSLFTREWIEMAVSLTGDLSPETSPSLRGSGLKSAAPAEPATEAGLPLYEGVDWNQFVIGWPFLVFVSLFTREWIEIFLLPLRDGMPLVSLFTREWIEIVERFGFLLPILVSLFTREWIEIFLLPLRDGMPLVSLFTREWIEIVERFGFLLPILVSLFTREWIEIGQRFRLLNRCRPVSLFTREWIEILNRTTTAYLMPMSPSLRGSGLKLHPTRQGYGTAGLPLYEGVDWNA